MKKIAILGSTGSIGQQTLQVVKDNPQFEVKSLTAFSNSDLLYKQAMEFDVHCYGTVTSQGEDILIQAVKQDIDLAVIATGGIASISAVLYCIENNIDLAIANKEIIVCCWELIQDALKTSKSRIIPVDSEHSAIFQCKGNNEKKINRVFLTASGGAFYEYSTTQLAHITPEQASRHPKWNMGEDITIDCNTLFNKNLEVIEANRLFDIDIANICVVRHPQSIVHSMVEFCDGSVLAQLSCTDMRLPISYALNYPQRVESTLPKLTVSMLSSLNFEEIDEGKFPCVALCRNKSYTTGLMPTVMVAANTAARNLFRQGKIAFSQIYSVIDRVLSFYKLTDEQVTLGKVKQIYQQVINYTYSLYGE